VSVEDAQLRADLVERLVAAGCVAAEDEADEILAGAPDRVSAVAWAARRATGEPLAWIVGSAPFCGRRVVVAPGVYVPRPQTEELARRAADALSPGGWLADLCSGTGAVAAHVAASVAGSRVVGVDVDPEAVACARRNGVAAVRGHLGACLAGGRFDVVTCVAPYVPTGALAVLPGDVQRFEPRRALHGGADGLDLVRQVVAEAARLLRSGGVLLLELGGQQDRVLGPTLAEHGFVEVAAWRDEDDDLRGLRARRS
jgi:release factor glutamine methyltransferase